MSGNTNADGQNTHPEKENRGLLTGRRLLLTGPKDESESNTWLEAQLQSHGASVYHVPLIQIQTALNTHWEDISPQTFDWLFFTSKNGVHAFFDTSHAHSKHYTQLPIATVGSATASALETYQLQARFIAPQFNAESAAKSFIATYPKAGQHILWPCGNLANKQLCHILEAAHMRVTPFIVYETRLKQTLSAQEEALLSTLLESGVDIIVFTSASAVQGYHSLQLHHYGNAKAIACIGPKTAKAVTQHFERSATLQPTISTSPALLESILQHFQENRPL